MDGVTRFCWVDLPRRAAARGWESLAGVLADGHVLAGLGRVAGLLTLVSLVGGLVVGAYHPGFDVVFTESLPLVLTVLALGVLSAQLGLAVTLGYAIGDFFVQHTAWTTEAQPWQDVSGVLGQPFLANLLVVRVPLLIEYGLLAALAVGVPVAARSLGASVSLRLRLPDGMLLAVSAVVMSLTAFVITRFWAASAPLVIRPLFTWTVDVGLGGGTMPIEPVEPIQTNEMWIARVAVLAMLARALVTWWLGKQRATPVDRAEQALLAPLDAPPPARSPYRVVLRTFAVALGGVLFLAGMIESWWAAAVLACAFLLAQLVQSGDIPFPPRGWRRLVDRVPVLVRFGAVLLVVNGVAKAVLDRAIDEESFQLMVWPVALSILAMAVLVPDPASALPDEEAF